MYRHFYLHKYLLFYNVAVIEVCVCVCVRALGMGGVVNLRFTPVASHLYKLRGVISTIKRKMFVYFRFYTLG